MASAVGPYADEQYGVFPSFSSFDIPTVSRIKNVVCAYHTH